MNAPNTRPGGNGVTRGVSSAVTYAGNIDIGVKVWMFETELMGFFDEDFYTSHLPSAETAGVTVIVYEKPVPFAASERTFNASVVERRFQLKGRTRVLQASPAISRSRRPARASRRARAARSSRRTTRTRAPSRPADDPTPESARGAPENTIQRKSWENISALASVETVEQLAAVRDVPALLLPVFPSTQVFALPGTTVKVVPCPYEVNGKTTCVQCRLCLDDRRLFERNVVIAFAPHGPGARVVHNILGREGSSTDEAHRALELEPS